MALIVAASASCRLLEDVGPGSGGSTGGSRHPAGSLAAFIDGVKAVDNHTHANSTDLKDTGFDALPLDLLGSFELPARLQPMSADWVEAYQTLYGYQGDQLEEARIKVLLDNMDRVRAEQGEHFPTWVLDQVGTEVMLVNRLSMGPGLAPPRFRRVSYVDALLLPLSTQAEREVSKDRDRLFPEEAKHLSHDLGAVGLDDVPKTLDDYLEKVVTPTLEADKKSGCVAVKFEVAFLRALDFETASKRRAAEIYAEYAASGVPTRAEYKLLQDYLFRYIAKEAGRLEMAVHIHAFHGPGNFYQAAGSDPILMESVFNDPELRDTDFVLVHAGGVFADHAEAMLWKPNVYVDTSALTRVFSEARVAELLKDWLSQFPEKVLFGSDASSFGPGLGWEMGAWIATRSQRASLVMALSDMMAAGEIDRGRAEELATMVLRTNASRLYKLGLE